MDNARDTGSRILLDLLTQEEAIHLLWPEGRTEPPT
jgi:hypothetical protein